MSGFGGGGGFGGGKSGGFGGESGGGFGGGQAGPKAGGFGSSAGAGFGGGGGGFGTKTQGGGGFGSKTTEGGGGGFGSKPAGGGGFGASGEGGFGGKPSFGNANTGGGFGGNQGGGGFGSGPGAGKGAGDGGFGGGDSGASRSFGAPAQGGGFGSKPSGGGGGGFGSQPSGGGGFGSSKPSGGGFGDQPSGGGAGGGFGKAPSSGGGFGTNAKSETSGGGFGSGGGGGFGGKSGGGFGDSGGGGGGFGSGTGGGGFGSGGGGGFGSGGGGGFGSGGGGGGGGGGSGCRKCGEDGHFARECPNGPPGGNACRKCGEEGHFARECPNAPAGGGACRKCGEEGHFARECPQGGGGDAGGGACRKCGEEGHFARECPNAPPMTCRNCGAEGHRAAECTQPAKCGRCGEEGHMRSECSQPRGEDEPPAPVTYIPDDITVDEIFLDHIKTGLNFDKYDNIKVESTGKNMPPPIQNFSEAGLVPILVENIQKSGYTKPTPIQKHALPVILAGRDLMACAQTGSGKTAAFLLPIIQAIIKSDDATGELATQQKPKAIIVAPTRELAVQIEREARKFAYDSNCRTVCVYGGVAVAYQTTMISRGCGILVGTPGRLKHFIENNTVGVDNVRFVVLDEADRMLDQGFEPIIRQILESKGMPSKEERQTLMFSATFPPEIQSLAREFLKDDHVFKAVGILGGANADVVQEVHQVERADKRDKLVEMLQKDLANAKDADGAWVKKTVIFVETKRTADFISTVLSQNELPSTSIHGDREQRQREEALRDFKSGKRPFLVATSVAARGLDIKGVDHVINYDLPDDIADYVHRVGRTGRVGNIGRATAFYDRDQNGTIAAELIKILADAQQEVPEWLAAESGMGGGGVAGGEGFAPKHDAGDDVPLSLSLARLPHFTHEWFAGQLVECHSATHKLPVIPI